jgi:hypothetical protein
MPKKQSQLTAATSVDDADELNMVQGGTSKRVARDLVAPLPMNYIAGLITSNNVADAAKDLDIAVGVARDSTDVDNMRLTAAITKQIDAAWAVGDDQGGLDTGSVAATTLYAVWLIKRSDTGVVDVLFSTSFTAPTMPTDYDRKRLIGAIKTDATPDILPYTQVGDYFRYTTPIQDVNDTTITDDTYEEAAVSVPPSGIAHIYGNLANTTTTSLIDGRLWIRPKGASDPTNPQTAFSLCQVNAEFDQTTGIGQVLVDSASKLEYAASEQNGAATVLINTVGFTMLTRRDP